jgi:hypothetical protein
MRGDPERFRFGPSVPSGVALGVLALTLLGVWLTGTARLLPSEAKRRATLVAALTLVGFSAFAALLVRAPASSLSTTQWLVLLATGALVAHWRRRPPTRWSAESLSRDPPT